MRKIIPVLATLLLLLPRCKPSYSFTGTNINYNETKTINIKEFTNQATLVYPTMAQMFSERMRDVYTRSTRLRFVERNADIDIEGEITRYDLAQQAVKDDGYASQTRLTMAVRVRYRNNKNQQNKELNFSAYRDFSNNLPLTSVQDDLVRQLTEELVDQIFNGTMANW